MRRCHAERPDNIEYRVMLVRFPSDLAAMFACAEQDAPGFLSEINPNAGPIATGGSEQLAQRPGKDQNAQPATSILGPGRPGQPVVAFGGPFRIPVIPLFRDPQRSGAV